MVKMKKKIAKKPIKDKPKANGVVAVKHKAVVKKISENLGKAGKKISVERAMLDQGYSPSYARSGQIKKTRAWEQVVDEDINDDLLSTVHQGLLMSHRLEHMVFPPFNGDKGGDIDEPSNVFDEDGFDDVSSMSNKGSNHGEQLTDQDIRDMLASVNCTVRKIVHGDKARHVYFWSPDNRARKDGLDMGYKIKNRYKETFDVNVNRFKKASDEELAAMIAQGKRFFTKK